MTEFLRPVSQFLCRLPVPRGAGLLQPITPVWLGLWASALAFAWLLPNHYLPWTAFHSDAWLALVLGLGAAAVIFRLPSPVAWHAMPLFTAALVGVPFIQYASGMLPFAGQAWIATVYLLGLLLALLIGARWESASPGQMVDGLFFAIGVASILSVGLQLHQWLGLDGLDMFSMGSPGVRPYANLGQPNNLGTLLLWGLLACVWGVVTRKIRASVAVLMACYLLFGIVLTQSRTAWLGLLLLLGAAWAWRKLWPSKGMPWAVTGLCLYFLFCNRVLQWGGDALPLNLEGRLEGGLRPAAWRLLMDAVMQRPWFGFGWGEVRQAQLDVALEHPGLGTVFGHAHNLFLDLVLWCGLPIGLLVSASLVWWVSARARGVVDARDVVLLMFVVIVGNHAMLELPLHHAYFLLPAGCMMGALNARHGGAPVFRTPRWVLAGIWVVAAVLWALTIRDYVRVESNFLALRFEMAHIGTGPPGEPPNVLLLTQLRERIRFSRFVPKADLSDAELDWMRKVVTSSPGISELHKLATALALNQHPEEAQTWLRKLCKVARPEQCAMVGRVWAQQAQHNPKIAVVSWPN